MKDDVAQHVNHCARYFVDSLYRPWRGLWCGLAQGLDVDTHVAGLYKIKDWPYNWTSEDCRRPAWRWWHDDVWRRSAKKTLLTVPTQASTYIRDTRTLIRHQTQHDGVKDTTTPTFPPASWAKRWEMIFSPFTSSFSSHLKISHMSGDDVNKTWWLLVTTGITHKIRTDSLTSEKLTDWLTDWRQHTSRLGTARLGRL